MIKTDGTLWGVGNGYSGQLGDGTTVSRSSPVQIGALTTWADVSRNRNSVTARTTSKTLFSWGDGGTGELGHNNTTSLSSPVQIGALGTWKVTATDNSESQSSSAIKS